MSSNCETTLNVLEAELDGTPTGDDAQVARPGTAGYLPPIDELLFNRGYSEVFLNFLRLCLESEDKRPTVPELLQHDFLTQPGSYGPQVSLSELQAVRHFLARAPVGARPGTAGSSADLYMSAIADTVHAHWLDAPDHPESPKNNLVFDTAVTLGLGTTEVRATIDGKCAQLRQAATDQERAWGQRVRDRSERAARQTNPGRPRPDGEHRHQRHRTEPPRQEYPDVAHAGN